MASKQTTATSIPAILGKFYNSNPDLDILNINLLDKKTIQSLKLHTPKQDPVLTALRTWQRLLRICPDPEIASRLFEDKIHSAQQIAASGHSNFLNKYGKEFGQNTGGKSIAEDIYEKSQLVKNQTMHALANVHSLTARHNRSMRVNHLKEATEDFENLTDYQELFGSLNFCNCDECKSMLGPAAYFTDLMRIIDVAITIPNQTNPNPIPVGLSLKERRPDLWELELSCSNTKTMVPYLQIVNEVLENTVLKCLIAENPSAVPSVWKSIAQENFPFSTPFNLPLNQVRVLLKQFQINFGSLIETFNGSGNTSLGYSIEKLQLSEEAYKLITTPNTDPDFLSECYGVTITANDNGGLEHLEKMLRQTGLKRAQFISLLKQDLSDAEFQSTKTTYTTTHFGTELVMIIDNNNNVTGTFNDLYGSLQGVLTGTTITGTWSQASVDPNDSFGRFEFAVIQADMSFTGKWMKGYNGKWETTAWDGTLKIPRELVNMSDDFFINQGQAKNSFLKIQINVTDPNKPFEEIANLTHDALDRISRFVRLSQYINWDFMTLDWVMTSLGATKIDDKLLIDLADIKELSEQFSVSPITLSTCWFDLKTSGMGNGDYSTSYFDTIFNNPSLIRDGKNFDYYHPTSSVADKQLPNGSFYNPLYLNPPVDWVPGQNKSNIVNPVNDLIDPANLAYARKILSGIKANNNDLAAIVTYFFPETSSFKLDVSTLTTFCRHCFIAQQLILTVPEYLALLTLLGKSEDTLIDLKDLKEIHSTAKWMKEAGLNVYELDYILNGNDSLYVNKGYTDNSLLIFLNSLVFSFGQCIISGTSFMSNNVIEVVSAGFYNYFSNNSFIDNNGIALKTLTDIEKEKIKQLTLPDGTTYIPTPEQLDEVQKKLNQLFSDQNQLVYRGLATFFNINSNISETLSKGIAGIQKIDSLTAFFFSDNGKKTAPMIDFIKMFAQHRMLTEELNLSSKELENIYKYPQAYTDDGKGTFNFNPLLLSNVWNIWKMKRLVENFQDTHNQFIHFLELASDGTVTDQDLEQLCDLTGWDKDQCKFICSLIFGEGNLCKTVNQIYLVNNCFTASTKTGLDVYVLKSVTDLQLLPVATGTNWTMFNDQANVLTGALRAKYGNESWSAVFEKFNAPQLEQQRNVLEEYCLWKLGEIYKDIVTPRDLYEYLLIDVEMGGCNTVSYIRQALNTVQLYLQRCRLNLERNVSISSKDIHESWWQWLLSYQIWEANRRVFLYPENYLDPSLRKDKTEIFKQLENDLSQTDVRKETAEKAFRNYLDNFADMANLQYVDACQYTIDDPSLGPVDTLFLFAKTQSAPSQFYYICRQPGNIWSQWKPIDVAITSEYITPVFVFNKLFIFWTEITSEQLKDYVNDVKNTDQSNIFRVSIKYSYIDYTGNWIQPQTILDNSPFNVTNSTIGELYRPLTDLDFDGDNPYWHKLAAIPVVDADFDDPNFGRTSGNKLVLIYGPLMASIPDKKYDERNINVTRYNQNIIDYLYTNYLAAKNVNHAYPAKVYGQLPLETVIIIDEMLSPSTLIDNDLNIILQNDTTMVPPLQPALTTGGEKLIAGQGYNTLASNYFQVQSSKITPLLVPGKATEQSFYNIVLEIDQNKSKAIYNTLKTQPPGWIQADNTVIQGIKDVQVVTIRSYTATNFQQAQYIWNKLCEICYGSPVLLNSTQGTDKTMLPVRNSPGSFIFIHPTGSFLFESPTVPKITDTLSIRPGFAWLLNDGFINVELDINDGISTDICNKLKSSSINMVDGNGNVKISDVRNTSAQTMADNLTKAGRSVTIPQAEWILKAMLDKEITSVQCVGEESDININYYKIGFNTTRISTTTDNDLSRRLFTDGIDGVLQLSTQMAPVNIEHCFANFQASNLVNPPAAFYDNQVDFSGPFNAYFWELFYYVPILIADRLKANKQFKEAQHWYQHVFNPTIPPFTIDAKYFENKDIDVTKAADYFSKLTAALYISKGEVTTSGNDISLEALKITLPNIDDRIAREVQNMLQNAYLINQLNRYWQFRKFRNQTICSLKDDLGDAAQIKKYNDDPLDPNAIAQLRIGAFEKNTVMKYIDNLIEWGDMEFTQYTWESITTATMLYAYANDLLGPRPEPVGICSEEQEADFQQIQDFYKGNIPQFLIDLEQSITTVLNLSVGNSGIAFNDLHTYFCVPENKMLIGYWDLIEDRLHKIRHCLNINGQSKSLLLFETSANILQLSKAGVPDNSVFQSENPWQPAVPYYRFNAVLSRAYNITGSLIQLGNALLSALEKNDSEKLAVLTASQQIVLLNMMTLMKQQQIEMQKTVVISTNEALQSAGTRLNHYTNLLSQGLIPLETASLVLTAASIYPQIVASSIRGISIAGYLLPNTFGLAVGGMQFGDAINAGANISDSVANMLNQSASVMNTVAQYERRAEEWTLQQQIAESDVKQFTQQLDSAKLQLQYNEQDLTSHLRSIEQAKQVEEFLRGKFTDQELYQWMTTRLSSLYYDTYLLAVGLSMAAQSAYQYELNCYDRFITYNYWDSLRKGLLSGEALQLSLQQMEQSYLTKNRRVLEIQKTVSLRQLFPKEFLSFIWGHDKGERGELNFILSEKLFDFDFPGHYCRKIKTISISIPAVVGPYQNLNATLTQSSNYVLLKANPTDTSPVNYLIYKTSLNRTGNEPTVPSPDFLRTNWMPNQQIAVTKGMNDNGLFQLDFNDERYLPFEGTGAVSSWTFKLPPDTNRINFDSISDVIVTINYTALDGGTEFSNKVKSLYNSTDPQYQNLMAKSMEMNQTYASAWYKMFVTPPSNNSQSITFNVTDDSILTTLKNVRLTSVLLQIEASGNATVNDIGAGKEFLTLKMETTAKTGIEKKITIADNFGDISFNPGVNNLTPGWTLEFNLDNTPEVLLFDDPVKQLDPKKLLNIALVLVYEADPFK